MKQKFFELRLKTNGQKLYNFTNQTISWIKENSFNDGILNLSIQHTSASLIVQENADPDVQTDLINYFDKLVPMDEKSYIHKSEGKDDLSAMKKVMEKRQTEAGQLLFGHVLRGLENKRKGNMEITKWFNTAPIQTKPAAKTRRAYNHDSSDSSSDSSDSDEE